jgi:hypothetical protein
MDKKMLYKRELKEKMQAKVFFEKSRMELEY